MMVKTHLGTIATSLLIFLLASSAIAGSAEKVGLRISSLQISVWPEYDEPRVLVIYRGDLWAEVTPPVQIGFLISKGASINGAGRVGQDGSLLLEPYVVSPKGEADEVIINLSQRAFFLEYYYAPFGEGVGERNFNHSLALDYPIDQLTISVQEPLRSSDFNLTPQPTDVLSGQGGFRYHNYAHKGVRPGSKFDIKVSYKKSDDKPSVAKEILAPSQPAPTERLPAQVVAGIVMVSLSGGALIAIALYLFVGKRRTGASRARRTELKEIKPKGKETLINYCFSCGNKVEKGDKFCSRCGTDLRRIS
jgi:hypothetical protein